MTEHHEHRCSCGAPWPIVDADALRRQSGGPVLAASTTGTVQSSGTVTITGHATNTAPSPLLPVETTVRIPA
jgi:hypothetical protein